jgi:uncharacterized membrane protein (DUF373 family)
MIVADLVAVLLLATLVGVLASGRAGLSRSFTFYVASALVTNRLIRWWPEQFYTTGFFSAKELVFAALSILIVLELAWSGLASFPRARRISCALGLVVAIAFVLGVLQLSGTADYRTRMGVLVASGQLFALVALVAFLGVVQWYGLPLRPWHRAIVLGFLLYRGVYGLLLGALGHFGGPVYAFVAELDRAAYAATVGLWTAAAWRPEWNDLRARARVGTGALPRS